MQHLSKAFAFAVAASVLFAVAFAPQSTRADGFTYNAGTYAIVNVPGASSA